MNFRYIDYSVNTGEKNMQIDSDLLDNAINLKLSEPIFRLYGWSPACISLGRNQSDDFIDKELLRNKNIDLVKRLTGGRALLHDDEITYCIICPVSYLENGEHVATSYKELSQILIDKFKKLDIELDYGNSKPINTKFDYCMLISTGADLCYKNKKLIGSAQCRKNGYILQHGSILYNYNKELITSIFNEDIEQNTITCIKEINPDLTKEDIIHEFYSN